MRNGWVIKNLYPFRSRFGHFIQYLFIYAYVKFEQNEIYHAQTVKHKLIIISCDIVISILCTYNTNNPKFRSSSGFSISNTCHCQNVVDIIRHRKNRSNRSRNKRINRVGSLRFGIHSIRTTTVTEQKYRQRRKMVAMAVFALKKTINFHLYYICIVFVCVI